MVSGSISLPSPGFFSPFPRGTGSLSVIRRYLALEGGPPGFPRDNTCPVVLRCPSVLLTVSPTGLSPSLIGLPRPFGYPSESRGFKPDGSYNPRVQARRFGLVPVRSPLLGESLLISLPPGTEMFHFPGCASTSLHSWMIPYYRDRVAPFGNLRIKGCLLLPEAYRSSPRPSSLPDAKASTVRPYYLVPLTARPR